MVLLPTGMAYEPCTSVGSRWVLLRRSRSLGTNCALCGGPSVSRSRYLLACPQSASKRRSFLSSCVGAQDFPATGSDAYPICSAHEFIEIYSRLNSRGPVAPARVRDSFLMLSADTPASDVGLTSGHARGLRGGATLGSKRRTHQRPRQGLRECWDHRAIVRDVDRSACQHWPYRMAVLERGSRPIPCLHRRSEPSS
jgi:hypothetical protein